MWSATAVAGPQGRVVRVERTPTWHAAPGICDLHGDVGLCFGEEPRAGQTVIALDERQVVAELQVVEASNQVLRCANLWRIKTRATRGALHDGEGIGLIDRSVDVQRAHVIDHPDLRMGPGGHTGDDVWRAIDRDGDGDADAMLTRYTCDDTGHPVAGASSHCIDVWARIGKRMTRTAQINLAQCNL
jgi:hypothetical protein